jgi:ribosomal protein S18 acetylase RimI-like enzyme
VTSSTAIFACADVEATLAYYRDVLGFANTWKWDDPPTFGGASHGGVSLMFSLQPELAGKVRGHEHWVSVEDADALYARHRASGAKIVEEIANKPWGAREYVVEDPNGYRLRFGGPPSGKAKPSEPFPEGVELERRKPSPEEFRRVTNAAFHKQEIGFGQTAEEVLARTWQGVVALSPAGEAVGVARIVQDAPGWFSVWDVGVDPAWQGKQIGSKLMEEALAMVGEASPGSFVFLFTFQHGFYEKLGFRKETVQIRKV